MYVQSLARHKQVKSLIAEHPHCADYVLPLWAHKQGALAPIWAEVEVQLSEGASLLSYPVCKQSKKHPHQRANRRLKGASANQNQSSSSSSSSEEVSIVGKHGVLNVGSHISAPGDASVSTCYVLTAKEMLENEERGECVSLIAKEFDVTDDLPTFKGKARQAKNLVFW
ncbi:hypothetical protein EON63_06905 [archaeon]|nr:MAG: hypothetical protein EON63_06905 [archaeon]